MLTRQQIIKTIRSIHRQEEPLNITAVKRRHPELIQAVYAVKPFWGWKQALTDAGIDYRKIKIELLDYYDCDLCGKSCRNLANHLILKHHVRPDEYLMDYPEADLQSEQLRAGKMGPKTPPIRHWEPIWSREYVLDRIAEYHRQGYAMYIHKFRYTDVSLYLAARRFCGRWREALLDVGIDPDELTRKAFFQRHYYPDKQSVIIGIQERQRKGWRLSRNALYGNGKGKKRPNTTLTIRGVEFFGSWGNALRAAGIDPGPVQMAGSKRLRYPSAEKVIREIRARMKHKWRVNHRTMYVGPHDDVSLVHAGYAYFGSWNNALKAAGLNPAKIRYKRVYQRQRKGNRG
ncbi:MAG: hypothetical protein Q7J98_13995 [Kiritimatiellia bacterium]|nr:hypothetical protein [Kiritimatiellia bacterium]